MKTFREMLTLGRVRGMHEKRFASLSEQELCDVRDWLYKLAREIAMMARVAGYVLLRTE